MARLRRVGAARFPARVELPPVWTLVVAASFCGYFVFVFACDLMRPVNPGFTADSFEGKGVVISMVQPNTPAAEAGLLVGDHLVSVNGLEIIDSDSWGAVGAYYQTGVAMPMVIRRQGIESTLSLLLPAESLDYWSKRTGATLLLMRFAQIVTLAAGLVVAFRRPRDPDALAASWFLMTCAAFLIALPMGFAVKWRALPFPLRELFWIPYASALTTGPILLTFVTLFPRRLPGAAIIQATIWTAAAVTMARPVYNATQLVYVGTELREVGPNSYPLLVVSGVSLLAAVAWSVSSYLRVEDINERRRLRVVVGGIAIAVLPGFSALVYFWMFRETNQADSIFESPGMAVVAVTLLAAPMSITYAVLRHRLFDLTFTFRRALQYTLARLFVLSLVPGISIFMIAATLRLHDKTVDEVLARHGELFAMLTVVAFVIFKYRRRWLRAIDRRFFRERHYAYEVLADLATQVRRAGSIERAAPLVVARIESVLHSEFAAVLLRDPADRMFRSIAAAPAAAAPADLRDDSSLVLLARDTDLPFDLSTDGGQALLQRLPAWDRHYIQQADIELLIRIVTPDDEVHAMLAIGPKRSEEPYTDEDRGVLVTVAENLSMLVGREPSRSARIPTLEECPKCGACFDEGSRVCSDHASPLVAVALPRTLGGRYRLNRRLASGGMGTVYEAFDTVLDHTVAAKVVRDDMTSSRGAIERFFEEAKHVGKLRDHPNVVTAYDYGRLGEYQAYLIMELLQGRTLRQLLEAGPIRPALALAILEDVGAAIGYAHKHKLVHRDLKPENIFLVEHNRGTTAKVLDFGIAKPLSVATTVHGRPLTHDRVLVGTLEYMSPEQRRGLPPSRAWDLWSLALVALEMLSGAAPMQLMPPGLGAWHPGLVLKDTLPACVDVFNRALSIEPAERPTDAEAFCRELATALRARA